MPAHNHDYLVKKDKGKQHVFLLGFILVLQLIILSQVFFSLSYL